MLLKHFFESVTFTPNFLIAPANIVGCGAERLPLTTVGAVFIGFAGIVGWGAERPSMTAFAPEVLGQVILSFLVSFETDLPIFVCVRRCVYV